MHIRFHVGGPRFHPVDEQATIITTWLDPHIRVSVRSDTAAFAELDDVDVLVLMGMQWTGMAAQNAGEYTHPSAEAKANFYRYCASGRPLVLHHGVIGAYDDWSEFGQTIGVRWGVKRASHSPFQTHLIHVPSTTHPLTHGLSDFHTDDEIYYQLKFDDHRQPVHHAWATWDAQSHPVLTTFPRSNTLGDMVFIALGHNVRSLEAPAMRRLWRNSITYLTRSHPSI